MATRSKSWAFVIPSVCRNCSDLANVEIETVVRNSSDACELETCLRNTVKLERAYGGCLGVERRRRTWTAAISLGELLTSFDPGISECENARRVYLPTLVANLLN